MPGPSRWKPCLLCCCFFLFSYCNTWATPRETASVLPLPPTHHHPSACHPLVSWLLGGYSWKLHGPGTAPHCLEAMPTPQLNECMLWEGSKGRGENSNFANSASNYPATVRAQAKSCDFMGHIHWIHRPDPAHRLNFVNP